MSFLSLFFLKYHSGGVQSSGPSSEPQSRGALRARLASVCATKVGPTARAGSPRREMDRPARVCAREFVGVSAGLSGRCVRGDVRNPGETSASHRLGEPVRVF